MWILDIIAISILILGIVFYNILVRKRNRIDQAYYSIDVMLKKRYELIPMLVDTVKGFITHERETLESITQLRENILTGNMKVDGKVGSVLSLLTRCRCFSLCYFRSPYRSGITGS